MTHPSTEACPTFEQISRAFPEGGDPAITEHLAGCAACRQVWDDLRDLKAAGRALPFSPPSEARASELESRLLLAVQSTPSRSSRFGIGVLVGAAAASIAFFVAEWGLPKPAGETPPSPPLVAQAPTAPRSVEVQRQEERTAIERVKVKANDGARFERLSRHGNGGASKNEEVVRLEDGTLEVDVPALAAEDRFRVVTPEGEVEVRGAAFRVHVALGQLKSVEVIAGRAELRTKEGAPVRLAQGERWTAPVQPVQKAEGAPVVVAKVTEVSAPEPVVMPRPVAPPRRPKKLIEEPTAKASAAPVTIGTAAESTFVEAWERFVQGDHDAASAGFNKVLERAPGDAMAEDARYWLAVALAKDHNEGAEAAMRDFLVRHPGSSRAGEVALMLGWQLLNKGDQEGAAARFHAAALDPAPRIKAGAAQGLAALGVRPVQTAP